jgi:hypothetical protein
MRHARRNLQRIARLAAVGGLVCGGLMVSSAMASEPPAQGTAGDSPTQAAELSASLVSRLGASRTAGSWMGADGRPVVAVTDADAAAEVRRAGANAKVVPYSLSRLRSATEALSAAPRTVGTAWAVDYASNKVVVRADSTVSAADWSRMTDVAEKIGGSVQMERTKGTFTTKLNGAVPIFAGNGRCSAGFNVTNGREAFILTAGHCGPVGTTWFRDTQGNERVGTTVAGTFPGNDFSLVQYQNNDPRNGTNIVDIGGGKGIQIVGAGDAVVGQRVFRSGSTTGFRSGQVTAVNATVNYPEGTVSGLIETTLCAEPGDSGGPMFAEGLALGVTSGGDGDCTKGGVTFFQPATKALETLGVSLAGTAPAAGQAAGTPPAPSAATGTVPQGSPGVADASAIVTDLVSMKNLGPGLTVIGASLIGLVAARWIRSSQDRRNFRKYYSASWS